MGANLVPPLIRRIIVEGDRIPGGMCSLFIAIFVDKVLGADILDYKVFVVLEFVGKGMSIYFRWTAKLD